MGTIVKTLLTGASRVLGGIWGYVAIGVVSSIVASSGIGYVVHRVDTAAYEELQLRDAKAATAIAEQTTEAVTAEKDIEVDEANDVRDAAIAEAANQPVLVKRIEEVETQIPVYIPPIVNTRTCIPAAFVGLLNDAIAAGNSENGTTTSSIPTGQSVDACSTLDVSHLTSEIIERIIKPAEQNAQQLNALEAAIIKQIDDYNKEGPS